MTDNFKTYVCSYRMPDGSAWGFEIKATSFADAEVRLARIRGNGSIDGELALRIKVPGFLERLFGAT